MPLYKCKECGLTDDEAVPCRKCCKMLLPIADEVPATRNPKEVKKGAKK